MPTICGERLVVLSVNTNTGGWAIRDFITNKILEDTPTGKSRQQIEQEVVCSEYPPFYNAEEPADHDRWELYLILRTIAHHRRHDRTYDTTPPNNAFGQWRDMIPNWQAVQL